MPRPVSRSFTHFSPSVHLSPSVVHHDWHDTGHGRATNTVDSGAVLTDIVCDDKSHESKESVAIAA